MNIYAVVPAFVWSELNTYAVVPAFVYQTSTLMHMICEDLYDEMMHMMLQHLHEHCWLCSLVSLLSSHTPHGWHGRLLIVWGSEMRHAHFMAQSTIKRRIGLGEGTSVLDSSSSGLLTWPGQYVNKTAL